MPEVSLGNLEDWLIAIARHTKETRDFLETAHRDRRDGIGGSGSSAGGGGSDRAEFSRALDAVSRRLDNVVGRLTAIGVGQSTSLARRGFTGTVEGARLDYTMEQLSRQFAAMFMPVIQGLTYFGGRLEAGMRGMNGTDQNRMMGMIGGAAIGQMIAGPRAAVAGALLGPLGMNRLTGGAPGKYDDLIGAGAGALAGSRFGPVGAVVGAGVGAVAGGGGEVYSRMRESGSSRLMAGAVEASTTLGMRGLGVELAELTGYLPRARSAIVPERPVPPSAARRDVTLYQPQMTNAGEQHFKMQEGMIRATAGAGFEDAGPLKPFFDGMLEIIKLLGKIAGVTITFDPPRSSETAR